MRVAAACVLLLCGCETSVPPAPIAEHAAMADAARWLECTELSRAAMETTLLARGHLTKTDDWSEGLKCVTIEYLHAPAFFVELVGSRADVRHRFQGVVATDRTTELVALRERTLDWAQQRGGVVSFDTVDLDSDGTDEVVVHHGDPRQGTADRITLVTIHGATLSDLSGPYLRYDDPDLSESCEGSLAVEGSHLVVTTTASTGPSEHCPRLGRHVFAIGNERLAEVTP